MKLSQEERDKNEQWLEEFKERVDNAQREATELQRNEPGSETARNATLRFIDLEGDYLIACAAVEDLDANE